MTVAVLRFGGRPVLPWRNGGGRTREIAREPAGDAFDWRVSVAEVAGDGDFSACPGVDRIIALCDGPAMTLVVDGAEHALCRYAPFAFSGEAATSCRVPGGPTRDLNVMTRRSRCSAEMSVLPAGEAGIEVDGVRTALVVALAGAVDIHGSALTDPVRLDAFDALRLDDPGGLRVVGAGPVAVIRVGRADSGAGLDTEESDAWARRWVR